MSRLDREGGHKPKGRKRPKRWHRGKGESQRWQHVDLPETPEAVKVDPTTPTPPEPTRRSWPNRGDAA